MEERIKMTLLICNELKSAESERVKPISCSHMSPTSRTTIVSVHCRSSAAYEAATICTRSIPNGARM